MQMPKFVQLDKNSEYAKEAIIAIDQIFQKFGLDSELIEHLWAVPILSIYGEEGKPFLGKTIKENLAALLKENDGFKKGVNVDSMAALSERVGMSVDDIIEMDRQLITNLFRGVDKNRPMPIVIRDLTSQNEDSSITTAHSMVYVNPNDYVAFSPRNIVKYYKFSELEAKAFFCNIKQSGLYADCEKIKLIKPGANAYYRNVFIANYSSPRRYMWSFSQSLEERAFVQTNASDDYAKVLKLTDRPLPTLTLNSWRDIARRRFEKLNPESAWDDLSTQNQKRHLVNLIRHNSVSYTQSWASAKPEDMERIHDIIFDRTLRKIIIQYPYLADECRRQMDSRGISLNPSLSSL